MEKVEKEILEADEGRAVSCGALGEDQKPEIFEDHKEPSLT